MIIMVSQAVQGLDLIEYDSSESVLTISAQSVIAGDWSSPVLFSVSSVTTFSLMKFLIDGMADSSINANRRPNAKSAFNILAFLNFNIFNC